MKRILLLSALVASTVAVGLAQAPKYQVVPLWPKPFPVAKHWILGSVSGLAVDAQDHIWVVHRGVDSLQANEKGPTLEPWASQCCFSAPQVLEFDTAGNLVASWDVGSGKGYDWPHDPAGIAIDKQGNVWIAGGLPASNLPARGRGPAPEGDAAAARGRGRGDAAPAAARGRGGAPAAPARPADAQVVKFDKTGRFVSQIGKAGQTDGESSLSRPMGVAVDDAANEVYVADDGHSRIAVFDANTGAFKRAWKGNGSDFHVVSCVKIGKDGMVYVCDRENDRIQIFQKDGKFVKEAAVSSSTKADGSVWDLTWTPDGKNVLVADGHDKKIIILDAKSLAPVGSIGQGGRYPGEFYGVGSVGVDSKGNVYTGENYDGKRVQKFEKK